MMIGIMVFPLFWGGVVTLISYLSGWQALAGFYAEDGAPLRETRRFRSLSTRRKSSVPSSYSGVITYGVSETALFISVMILFRMGHKPLKIPFSDISIEKDKGIFSHEAHLQVSKVPGLILILPMKDIAWIEQVYDEVSE